MALSPGTRLGSYEIADRIGLGGMGEVYRATDTNLKRAVAIKVLPQSLDADVDRLALAPSMPKTSRSHCRWSSNGNLILRCFPRPFPRISGKHCARV